MVSTRHTRLARTWTCMWMGGEAEFSLVVVAVGGGGGCARVGVVRLMRRIAR